MTSTFCSITQELAIHFKFSLCFIDATTTKEKENTVQTTKMEPAIPSPSKVKRTCKYFYFF